MKPHNDLIHLCCVCFTLYLLSWNRNDHTMDKMMMKIVHRAGCNRCNRKPMKWDVCGLFVTMNTKRLQIY